MAITRSKRTKFVACHVAPDVKEELKETAHRLGVSTSALVAEAIDEKLEKLDVEPPTSVPPSAATPASAVAPKIEEI
jgi:hypothetical protein